MEMVTLRNKSELARILVASIKLNIESLWETNYMAVYEFSCLCADPSYQMFGNSDEILKKAGLMDSSGDIHSSIKNVMLSMAQGEGMEMTLVSPVAK